MKHRYKQFNNKRIIKVLTDIEHQQCNALAAQVRYGGNPEHKKNPGDFGLTPLSCARPGKSLCDAVNIFSRKIALQHLQSGLQKGLVSDRYHGNWPQNIWAVTDKGEALEAQLENSETGTYHGYPMPVKAGSDLARSHFFKKPRIQNFDTCRSKIIDISGTTVIPCINALAATRASRSEGRSDHAPIVITKNSGHGVVMISLEDYRALEETAYLLKSPRNASRLLESMRQSESISGI